MGIESISVEGKNLKFEPNLEDYEKTYKNFKWKDAWKEVELFDNGKINAAYNAIDRHVKTWKKNKVALYWISSQGKEEEYSFLDMHEYSNKFANLLNKIGVKKGDRCFIFLPRIPELYISFIGALKTGAVAGTMFSAFMPEGIKDRLQDSKAKVLITDSELIKRVYAIADELPALKHIIVVNKNKLKHEKSGIKKIQDN